MDVWIWLCYLFMLYLGSSHDCGYLICSYPIYGETIVENKKSLFITLFEKLYKEI